MGSVAAVFLAATLVPFFLYGEDLSTWSAALLAADHPPLVIGAAVAALLAADVLLPVPSSLVATGAGALLGLAGGALACWIGMTVGCALGYALGAGALRPAARRLAADADLDRIAALAARHGDWFLVVCRPVPVLAEASVVFAGMTRMSLTRFAALSALSNLGVSLAYAAVGALAVGVASFVLALAGAIALPAAAMGIARALRAR